MPISRRYTPAWAPGEGALIGMDFSFVVPPGVGILSGTLHFFDNTATPTNRDGDFVISGVVGGQPNDVNVLGRILWVALGGGVEGTDYQLLWTATDTFGLDYPRTALMLCAPTS
jgi:hypothetical protein